MNHSGNTAIGLVAQWRLARNLFPIYLELTRHAHECPPPPCSSFESDDRPESLQAIRQWFEAVDASLSPARFRTVLQAANAMHSDTMLHAIAQHFLARRDPVAPAREKLDFVLLRYFSVCSPPSFHARTVSRRNVADVLQPLVGDCPDGPAAAQPRLDQLLVRIAGCRTLDQFTALLKEAAGWEAGLQAHYFDPPVLVGLTHFHYLLHLAAVAAVDTTLSQMVKHLEGLRAKGVEHLDCSIAGMSEKEAVSGLIEKWKSWMVPQDVEFWLDELAAMLSGVEKAIAAAAGAPSDARVDTILAEMGRLRALAETMSAQLASLTQRLQRLEAKMELTSPWAPSAEAAAAAKFRSPLTPPPVLTRPEVFKTGRAVDAPPDVSSKAPESIPSKISKIR